MRYYSDELKRFYDTEPELLQAEKEAKEQLELKEKSRKELAKRVDAADALIDVAYKNYDKAKEEVSALVEDTRKKVNEILNVAREEVEAAEKEKAEAIKEFNEKFGVYTATYSGKKAVEQYNRTIKHFADIFDIAVTPFFGW